MLAAIEAARRSASRKPVRDADSALRAGFVYGGVEIPLFRWARDAFASAFALVQLLDAETKADSSLRSE
jgi:hypothetical protein